MRGKLATLRASVPATRGRASLLSLAILLVPILIGAPWVSPADGQTAKDRKIVIRVAPEYPETLKQLYIGGVVHVQAVVAPNGTVERTALLGGNPVLGQSAMKAIKQWKYANAAAREELEIWVEFDPHR
jgi:TonB family protein